MLICYPLLLHAHRAQPCSFTLARNLWRVLSNFTTGRMYNRKNFGGTETVRIESDQVGGVRLRSTAQQGGCEKLGARASGTFGAGGRAANRQCTGQGEERSQGGCKQGKRKQGTASGGKEAREERVAEGK